MTGEQSPSAPSSSPFGDLAESDLRERFERLDYVANERVVTAVYLALRIGRPLLAEGPPGSGKTELGKVLAEAFDTELIRLQCYEGLTVENALYEWNYTKQLLAVQSDEGSVKSDVRAVDAGATGSESGGPEAESPSDRAAARPDSVFGEEYLLERPLLRVLTAEGDRPPVLLVDEIDRADEEFEAFLLELLSEFQVSIPELGTVAADHPPVVVLTSNRTRALSDALKRRCLYLYVEPPSFEAEYDIVTRKVPELDAVVAAEVCAIVERLREESFLKRPGVAETLDWARAVAAMRADSTDRAETGGSDDASTTDGDPRAGRSAAISAAEIERSIGCLLKEIEDVERVDAELLERLRDAAAAAVDRVEGDADGSAS